MRISTVDMMLAGYSSAEMMRAAHGKPCPYCHKTMLRGARRHPTRDHICPRSNGGKLCRGNCLIACAPCNGDKGSRSLHGWLRSLRRNGDARALVIEKLLDEIWRRRVKGAGKPVQNCNPGAPLSS